MEWKLEVELTVKALFTSLETFLSGMETKTYYPSLTRQGETLKPSLVEWKLAQGLGWRAAWNTLKPSLVEWKHEMYRKYAGYNSNLETFLSGMETRTMGTMGVCPRRPLKPSLVEWKPVGMLIRSIRTPSP